MALPMKRKPSLSTSSFLSLLIAISLPAIHARALPDDPWKSKEYTKWTLEEVQRILSDSPWVKTDFVDAPWIKGQPHWLTTLPPGCGRPNFRNPSRQPPQLGPMTQSIVGFQITWQSARTIRSARLRLAAICGNQDLDSDEAEELLEREQEGIIITVHSPDMTPFDGLSDEQLLQITSLNIKRTRQRVAPSRVVVMRGMDQRSVFSVTFIFPKTTDAGSPVISPEEKDVEFVTQPGKVTIKAKFQPPKMVSREGADF
jgi:hypothetical protein